MLDAPQRPGCGRAWGMVSVRPGRGSGPGSEGPACGDVRHEIGKGEGRVGHAQAFPSPVERCSRCLNRRFAMGKGRSAPERTDAFGFDALLCRERAVQAPDCGVFGQAWLSVCGRCRFFRTTLRRLFRSEANVIIEAAEGRRADFEIRASERDFRKRQHV